MSVAWTITNPGGSGISAFADLGLSDPQIDFQIQGVSTASAISIREFDSGAAWWAADEPVTIYRAGQPCYTGRVQETPAGASQDDESRTLNLADAWQDFEEVIYQEEWPIGAGTVLYPRCILGRKSTGELIKTGAQIGEVIDYLMSQGVQIQKGTIAEGFQLWPSECRNTSCESVITGEMRFHPDWAAWLDHTTSPPTFHAMAKADLDELVIDIGDETVVRQQWAKVVRNVPKGVRIIYESAKTIDGEVFRDAYLDEAGVTTGRKVMQAMLDLEGMTMQFQKSRIKVRDIPLEGTHAEKKDEWKAFMAANFPKLAELPGDSWTIRNFKTTLVPDPGGHPDPVCPKATRLVVANKSDLPNQLVNGQIEDWMKKKVGQITITYDFEINPAVGEANRPLLKPFEGKQLSMTVTATNAITKLYKGVSSFTEGEGRPVGLAAAIFAAATEEQFQGAVTTVKADVDAGRFHGKRLKLVNGASTVMPGAVIHSASVDIERGSLSLSFGPMPFLSAGDFLELQRMFKRRPVTWMSAQERTSNELGAQESAGSKGDTVTGYDLPTTVTPSGGRDTPPRFWAEVTGNTTDGFKMRMEDGYVFARKNSTGDAVTAWKPTSIPDDTSVAINDIVMVKVDESANGIVTAAGVVIASSVPASLAPVLPGGDNATGTAGYRYYKLCKVVSDGATGAKLERYIDGDIYHAQPVLADNTISSASGNQARPLKRWNATAGRWDFRYAEGSAAAYGVAVTESGDKMGFDTKGGNLNLTVEVASLSFSIEDGDVPYISYTKTVAEETVHYWRKGVYVGTTEPTEEPVGGIDYANVSFFTDPL